MLAASFARCSLLAVGRAGGLRQAGWHGALRLAPRSTSTAGPASGSPGTFDGIEPDGALRLRLEDGSIEIVRAGDVSLG